MTLPSDSDLRAAALGMLGRLVPIVWWFCDLELRILRTGGSVMEILGYAPNTYVGRTIYEAVGEDPGTHANDAITGHERAVRGEIATYVTYYRGKYVTNTIAPYHVNGVQIGVIGTLVDSTTSHALEQRMVDAQRAESLGLLAGGLAHDFANLLVAILGNADLGLRETPAGAPGYHALENIRSAGLRAAELTEQLLAYAGRGGVPTANVAPAPLVGELVQISSSRMPSNITVSVDIPAQLAIRADAGQVRQVVLNLLGNAREALGERGGNIKITASALHHDGVVDSDDILAAATGEYVVLEVADDGPGMDYQTRRHIFEPFFTTKSHGHGLGLAAVLGIVRAHGGGIRLETSPGAGAKFRILWPASPKVEEPAPRASSMHTVLVIDDEELVRDIVARMIEDLGYTAITAGSGESGLELVDKQKVDAVLVDLSMPTMSGAEVVARLRKSHPALPVILCTGYDRDRRGPVEATAYLPKPFRLEALEATLAKLFA